MLQVCAYAHQMSKQVFKSIPRQQSTNSFSSVRFIWTSFLSICHSVWLFLFQISSRKRSIFFDFYLSQNAFTLPSLSLSLSNSSFSLSFKFATTWKMKKPLIFNRVSTTVFTMQRSHTKINQMAKHLHTKQITRILLLDACIFDIEKVKWQIHSRCQSPHCTDAYFNRCDTSITVTIFPRFQFKFVRSTTRNWRQWKLDKCGIHKHIYIYVICISPTSHGIHCCTLCRVHKFPKQETKREYAPLTTLWNKLYASARKTHQRTKHNCEYYYFGSLVPFEYIYNLFNNFRFDWIVIQLT